MLFIAAAILIVGFLGFAFIGITAARAGVHQLEAEVDMMAAARIATAKSQSEDEGVKAPIDVKQEALDANRFSSSLISLSTSHSLAKRNSPEHVHDESSSLASIPQPRS
jgi:hypothetical protein